MNTTEIMNMALKLVGWNDIPSDSKIHNPGKNIKRILFGIDIWPKDLVYAKENGFDLVISHHPPCIIVGEGFLKVMDRYLDIFELAGVTKECAENALFQVKEMWKSSPYVDFSKSDDEIIKQAIELDMPLMNIHLPSDELGRRLLQRVVDGVSSDATVSELITAFEKLDEMKKTWEIIPLISGNFKSKIRKTIVAHGAGANGGYHVANTLFEAGVDTVIYISFFPNQRADGERLREENKGNLIISGHYASDSLGINPLIDELENKNIEIKTCNKLIR